MSYTQIPILKSYLKLIQKQIPLNRWINLKIKKQFKKANWQINGQIKIVNNPKKDPHGKWGQGG